MDELNSRKKESYSTVPLMRGLNTVLSEEIQVELKGLSIQENPSYQPVSTAVGARKRSAEYTEITFTESRDVIVNTNIAYNTITQLHDCTGNDDITATENTTNQQTGNNESDIFQEIPNQAENSSTGAPPDQTQDEILTTASKICSFCQGRVEVVIGIAIILVSETQNFQCKAFSYTCNNIYMHAIHMHV